MAPPRPAGVVRPRPTVRSPASRFHPGARRCAVGVVLVGCDEQGGVVADPIGPRVEEHLGPPVLDGLLDRREPHGGVERDGPVMALTLDGQGGESGALGQQAKQVAAVESQGDLAVAVELGVGMRRSGSECACKPFSHAASRERRSVGRASPPVGAHRRSTGSLVRLVVPVVFTSSAAGTAPLHCTALHCTTPGRVIASSGDPARREVQPLAPHPHGGPACWELRHAPTSTCTRQPRVRRGISACGPGRAGGRRRPPRSPPGCCGPPPSPPARCCWRSAPSAPCPAG